MEWYFLLSQAHHALYLEIIDVYKRQTENRLYIRYIRRLLKEEQFDTAVIYSDVAGETAIRAIKADKYLMFYQMCIRDRSLTILWPERFLRT